MKMICGKCAWLRGTFGNTADRLKRLNAWLTNHKQPPLIVNDYGNLRTKPAITERKQYFLSKSAAEEWLNTRPPSIRRGYEIIHRQYKGWSVV